jgi:hypothetical protein
LFTSRRSAALEAASSFLDQRQQQGDRQGGEGEQVEAGGVAFHASVSRQAPGVSAGGSVLSVRRLRFRLYDFSYKGISDREPASARILDSQLVGLKTVLSGRLRCPRTAFPFGNCANWRDREAQK